LVKVTLSLSSHLSVTEAKQQRHAKTLARGDDRGRDLVDGLPRRAGLRSERRHDVLETQQRYEDERGPHRFAGPTRRRGRLVVAVHAAVVPLETWNGNAFSFTVSRTITIDQNTRRHGRTTMTGRGLIDAHTKRSTAVKPVLIEKIRLQTRIR